MNYRTVWLHHLATNDNQELSVYRTDDVDRVESPTEEEIAGEIDMQERITEAKRIAAGRPMTAALVARQLTVLFPGQTRRPTEEESLAYRRTGDAA